MSSGMLRRDISCGLIIIIIIKEFSTCNKMLFTKGIFGEAYKMHQSCFRFGRGSATDPAGELQCSPGLLVD